MYVCWGWGGVYLFMWDGMGATDLYSHTNTASSKHTQAPAQQMVTKSVVLSDGTYATQARYLTYLFVLDVCVRFVCIDGGM